MSRSLALYIYIVSGLPGLSLLNLHGQYVFSSEFTRSILSLSWVYKNSIVSVLSSQCFYYLFSELTRSILSLSEFIRSVLSPLSWVYYFYSCLCPESLFWVNNVTFLLSPAPAPTLFTDWYCAVFTLPQKPVSKGLWFI